MDVNESSESFRRLFERYSRSIFYFFCKRGFSSEECRDLTQDTFLSVYKGMENFRQDSSVETWLFQIATNIYRNELRNRAAAKRSAPEVSFDDEGDLERAVSPTDPAMESGEPLEVVLEEERARLLREALDDLPPQMRRCVLLRLDSELRYREIAELMQLSIQTVKAHLHQARQRLRHKLASYFSDLDHLDRGEAP